MSQTEINRADSTLRDRLKDGDRVILTRGLKVEDKKGIKTSYPAGEYAAADLPAIAYEEGFVTVPKADLKSYMRASPLSPKSRPIDHTVKAIEQGLEPKEIAVLERPVDDRTGTTDQKTKTKTKN